MEQRQLRLGDILDDYCPRERRVTNHAVVAMVGADVKQTRCTTCDAEHEYQHAKVPRQRAKPDTPAALYQQVAAGAPKRVGREAAADVNREDSSAAPAPVSVAPGPAEPPAEEPLPTSLEDAEPAASADGESEPEEREEGPVHRPLIRASLPRTEGQPPPTRPLPEFTIRQPGGRTNRFRPRHQRGPQGFQGNQSNGNSGGGSFRGGGTPRGPGGRPPQGAAPRHARRHDQGRKRSK